MKEPFTLLAAATATAGAAVIDEGTPMSLSLFFAGIAAVVVAAWWLGSRFEKTTNELQNIVKELARGEARFARLEDSCEKVNERMNRLERHCISIHAKPFSLTQRINPGDIES